ncbi:MAG: porin family protein [Alphaproteobacteria bacterium]|nr:porin family protein [Alphaproteobacteria bacterium]
MKSHLFLFPVFLSFLGIQHSTKANSHFTGFRMGLQGAFAISGSKISIGRANCNNCGDRSDVFGRGVIGGLTIDYNKIMPGTGTLTGLELSANLGKFSGKRSIQGTLFGSSQSNLHTTISFQQAYDLCAKLGHLVGDYVLPYVKGGGSWARWNIRSQSDQLGFGRSTTGKLGVAVGAGIEFSLEEHAPLGIDTLSLAIEYTYRQYAHTNHNIVNNQDQVLRMAKVVPSLNTFMIRFSFKIAE